MSAKSVGIVNLKKSYSLLHLPLHERARTSHEEVRRPTRHDDRMRIKRLYQTMCRRREVSTRSGALVLSSGDAWSHGSIDAGHPVLASE